MVMTGEIIENAIRNRRIDAGESAKRSAPRKKKNEVNNANVGYLKSVTISQPKAITEAKQNNEKRQFTPIPMTYKELYQSLFDTHVVEPFYLKPLQPPFPKWYDADAQCEYHAGIVWHLIENCTTFNKLVERFIQMGIVKFDNEPNAENPLPNHTDSEVNVIDGGIGKRVKADITEVKTPLKWVWKEMARRGLVALSSEGSWDEIENYYEFHHEKGHRIQECEEMRAFIQSLMDKKEIEFYEEVKEEEYIYVSESTSNVPKFNRPVVIISRPKNEAGIQMTPKIIIQKPAVFSYKNNKRVSWNYDCNVTVSVKESSVSLLKEDQNIGSHTCSGKLYDLMVKQKRGKVVEPGVPVNEPVKEEEAKEFLKFLKHSEHSVVEQLHKQPARISILALLLSSKVHRSALLKVLNETYVTNDISVNKLNRLVNNIISDNFIFFNDDDIPPGGIGSTKALYITTRCKGYMLPRVLVDNGSVLNVLPLSTLNRLLVDSSHMKGCQNIVREFDGIGKRVMGRIEIPLLIGPTTYEVDFLAMDSKPSYNCLLRRPWIHLAGVVPSSLHQKLKLVPEGQLVMINAEKDIIATVSSDVPYLEIDEEAIECSFWSLEFVNATFITEGSRILEQKNPKLQ
ncbi:uncharacterized protein LOC108485166 [Gossypium arboreum]|uniref:uncharacterized protein LOC108485166 n=1 Tax=Gossypium arboreum TaxID=29729 RepID=UPI0008195986|nr:uncharacterized protein LOC108485166 [Gossypium arboreum]